MLRIFLSIPCTNYNSERSFYVLKRIKTRLRSTLTQEKLDNLGLLSIESNLTSSLNFDDIINKYALKKTRKVILENSKINYFYFKYKNVLFPVFLVNE